jgi:acetylornithine deacetylase/succinyl-diaminopimelate desuccinylase-like protein
VIAHLLALRALDGELPVNVKMISEGSEEQGSGGLDQSVAQNADLLRADAILIGDGGNFEAGLPTITTSLRGVANVIVTVKALRGALHSGLYGGAAPDPFIALVHILASLRDEHGNTTVDGLDNKQTWDGIEYPPDRFRRDAGILDGVDVIGDGSVAEMLWERPVLTVLGVDFPQVSGSVAAIQPQVRCRLNLRIPPDADVGAARDELVHHVRAHAPWNVQLEFEHDVAGAGFVGSTGGPALDALKAAMQDAYGKTAQTMGVGGAIPLCSVLKETYPEAEIMILGVEEPSTLIHAAN